jgi:hypothetical protein
MRLPVTLAIVRALLVQVGVHTYAVPAAHVVEAVEFDEVARLTLRGKEAVSMRDEVVPLVRLRRVFGATTAGSQFGRNAVFHQNQVVEARSDFEVRDRIQLSVARQFHFFGKFFGPDRARTLVSLYYEGRTGSPFSWVYSNDLNTDGITANDLVAVPANASDQRFNFSGMSAAAVDSYFAFLRQSGLERYAGGYAPRNAFDQPWVNRLDLKLSQDIPIFKPAQLEVFLDFTNFGAFLGSKLFNYYERTTFVESDTFWRRSWRAGSPATARRRRWRSPAPTRPSRRSTSRSSTIPPAWRRGSAARCCRPAASGSTPRRR